MKLARRWNSADPDQLADYLKAAAVGVVEVVAAAAAAAAYVESAVAAFVGNVAAVEE